MAFAASRSIAQHPDSHTAMPGDYFFCSIGAPQHFNMPVPPLVTITCELHLLQM
jgi:hypothetical protein